MIWVPVLFLMCAQMLMHATAHRDCTDTVQESLHWKLILREKSLREKSLREKSLREKSLRDKSLREKSLREKSLREKSLREKSLQHWGLKPTSVLH